MFHFSRKRLFSIATDSIVFLFGVMWIYSGISKLMNLWGLIDTIMQYRLLPSSWVVMAASTLPWFELLLGLGLIMCLLPYLRKFPENRIFLLVMMWMSLILLSIFLVAMLSVVGRGLEVTCGCFGSDSQLVGWWTITRDMGLLALNAVVLMRLRG